MDGPRAGVDPDQVEEDVMGYYRNIYKLEKQFDKEPNPKNIAVKVRNSLTYGDAFHHFPPPETVLRFLKRNLCPYLGRASLRIKPVSDAL